MEVFGASYGLRESNRLFTLEITRVIRTAGFTPSIVSPTTFVAFLPRARKKKCVLTLHVDDGRMLDNCPRLTERLLAALTVRFGKMTTHDPSVTYAGIEMCAHSNGAVSVSQSRYIERVAVRVGVAHLPPVDVPAHSDFF